MNKPSTPADSAETTRSDTTLDRGPGSETVPDGSDLVTRRQFGKAFGGLVAVVIGGGTYTSAASRSVLGASGQDEWVAQGASTTTTDGSVDQLTFGDTGNEDDELHLSWSGLNADDREVNFRILVKGNDDGDENGWNNGAVGAETDYEELARAEPGIELGGTNGSGDFTWTDVFGSDQPVDINDHSEIDVTADFSEEHDGETRERELTVDVEVWIDEEDGRSGPEEDSLGDRKTTAATISVTREEPTVAVEDLFAEITSTHHNHRDRPREVTIAYEFTGSPNVTFWARDGRGITDERTMCAAGDGDVSLGDPWGGNNTGEVAVEVNIHDDTCYRTVLSYNSQQSAWETSEWEEDWSETCERSVERGGEC